VELRTVTSIKFFLKVLPVNASSVKQNQCFLLDLADWVTYLTIKFLKFSIFSVQRQPTLIFLAYKVEALQ
jgi:hypothetical protein